MSEIMVLSIVAMFVAQAADILTTVVGLRRGMREANPIVAWAMRALGDRGWILLKLAVAGLAAWSAVSADLPVILWGATALIGAVAWRNFRMLR